MSRRLFLSIIVLVIILVVVFIFYLGWRRVSETPNVIVDTEGGDIIAEQPTSAVSEQFTEADEEGSSVYKKETNQFLVSPDKTQIASLEKESGSIFLKVKDIKTNATKRRISLNIEDADLVWATTNEIFIVEKPTKVVNNSVFRFNLKNSSLDYYNRGERGLIVNWFDNGSKVLKYSETTKVLSLTDNKTASVLNLPFLTLPTKCTYQNDYFYCAVPSEIPENIFFPDDYLKRRFYSQDSIIALSFKENAVKTLVPREPRLDAVDLRVIGDQLYFTNRHDGKIYKTDLQ